MKAVVRISRHKGPLATDSEIPVRSLEELYEACRLLAPMDLVRLTLQGEAGEVNLDFGSFIRKP